MFREKERSQHMRIRNKILLINNIAFLIIFVGFSLFIYIQVRDLVSDNIKQELQNKNESIVNLIESSTNVSIKTHLRTISERNWELMNMFYERYQNGEFSEEEAYNRVKEIFLDPEYGKIGKTGYLAGVTTEGVLEIHPKSAGVDASGFEFMQRAMEMKNGYLEYMWKNEGEEEKRAKAGWLSYFEPWDIMVWASSYKSEFTHLINPEDFRKKILDMELGESGYPFIMDSDGNLIIHPHQEGENIYDSQDESGRYFIREMCETKEGTISYSWKNQGEEKAREKVAEYSYIKELDWIVATTFYEDEMYTSLYTLRLSFIVFIAAALVVVFFLNLWIGFFISRPIKKISSGIKENLTGKISLNQSVSVSTNDEIGTVAEMFNHFTQNVKDVVKDLQSVNENNKSIGENLATNSEEVSATIEEISGTTQSFKQKTEVLDNEVQQTTNAVEEMKESIDSISSHIEEQSSVVTQSSTAIESMTDSVQRLSSLAQEKQSQLDNLTSIAEKSEKDLSETVSAIQEIADSATSIFDMVKMINQVAAQTNLLAMNAAIEAAHAGEAGRGFAVVAEEIRNLAETTSSNTKDISDSLKTIFQKIDNTKQLSQDTGKTFKKMHDDIISIADSINELLTGMNEMSSGSEQINTGVESMRTSTEEVRDSSKHIDEKITVIQNSMQQLSQLSSEHVEGINEITTGIEQILEAVNTLTELGTQNSENIDTIDKKIVQFDV
jgi:methyl-accepting chemotaxis protein